MSKKRKEDVMKKERIQAVQFAASLELNKEKVDRIDDWIDSYILLKIRSDLHTNLTDEFNPLFHSLEEHLSRLNINQSKYLLGRMIKMYDLMWGGVFTPVIDSSTWRIQEFIDKLHTPLSVFNPIEFTSLLAYLKGTPVDPNSDLFSSIWKIEKNSQFFRNADFFNRNKALKYLLDLNGARGFHHTLKDFKHILKKIQPDNADIIYYLNQYKVENNQGCFSIIHFIFTDMPKHSFQIKRDCIFWLDNALGSSPKKPWLDKLASIQRELKEEELLKIVNKILLNDTLGMDQSTGWEDSIYKRFHKSATWYLSTIKDNETKK